VNGGSLSRVVVLVALIGAALLLVAVSPAAAQETPEFDVDMVTLRAPEGRSPLIDVYTRIPLSKLRFINSPNGFTASYEVSADVIELGDDGRRSNIVQSPLWERTVTVPNYAQTTEATRYDFSTNSITLEPGLYVFEFQIQDKSSGENFVLEKVMAVRGIADQSALSDLLVLEDFDEATNTIYPSVSKRLPSTRDSLLFFYEMYLDDPREVVIQQEVRRISGSSLPSLRAPVSLEGARGEDNAVVYTASETRSIDSPRSQLVSRLPISELPVGGYQASFQLLDASGEVLDNSETTFEVQWSGLEEHLANVDEAISQLQYIAKTREIRRIRDAGSGTDKWKRFIEFWQRRDPTPGTARNEKMEEYYYRVAYANRQYTSITEGWRTDRGQVWVLYGEPDIVERHPYNFSVKPYEVWFYYRLGRRFIFVDQSGLGDYQLLVPIWDETTRIR
jgi:GWxTD domain-containing protein